MLRLKESMLIAEPNGKKKDQTIMQFMTKSPAFSTKTTLLCKLIKMAPLIKCDNFVLYPIINKIEDYNNS